MSETQHTQVLTPPQQGQLTAFRWNAEKERAALLLALGFSVREVTEDGEIEVCTRTVERWKDNPDFALELDRLTFLTSYATKAERIRFAKRMIRQAIGEDGHVKTKKDILDWLRFVREELEPTEYRSFIFATFAPIIQSAIETLDPVDVIEGEVIGEY